jgi:hypothetical protein
MYYIEVGTDQAKEGYRDPDSDDPELVRYRDVDGQRIVTLTVPDGVNLNEAFRTIVAALELHLVEGSVPAWVEANNANLVNMIVDQYQIDGNERPEDWGHHTNAHLSAQPGMLTTMMALVITFLLSRLFGLDLRTDIGRDFQARVMGDTAANGTGSYSSGKYIGVTANATAPSAASTTLTGEIVTGTLVRAQATYAHVSGTATYTLTKTFTSDQDVILAKLGVFNGAGPGGAASAANSLIFETLLNNTASMVSGDQTQITETVTLS